MAAMVTGSKACEKHLSAMMKACHELKRDADDRRLPSIPKRTPNLKAARSAAAKAPWCPENYILRVIQFASQGFKKIEFRTYDTDWDSEAYLTVSGQNSNNSVRVTDDFMRGGANPTATGA